MPGPMRHVARAAVVVAFTFALPVVAHADGSTALELTKPAERRSGLVFGFGVGMGVAGASGYPNSSSKIGDPTYYDGSDAMGGGGGTIFVMGALTDWLSFGAFYSRANFVSSNWNTYGGGGGIRVDFFPLYRLYPRLRDLAMYGQFGVGTATLSPQSGDRESSTGTESFLGGGFFYEFWLGRGLGGHFACGPTLEFDSQVTQSNQRFAGLVGLRLALYTGR